jgi:hypothetical protein
MLDNLAPYRYNITAVRYSPESILDLAGCVGGREINV